MQVGNQVCPVNAYFLEQKGLGIYMYTGIQGMENVMEIIVKDTHFFIDTEFVRHLPLMQLVSFLE